MKQCSKCGHTGPSEDFPEGRLQCRDCKRAYWKAYRVTNKDAIASSRQSRSERRTEVQKRWHTANPEKAIEYQRRYRQRLKERGQAYPAGDRQQQRHRRRARLAGGVPQRWVKSPEIEGCCYWCGSDITDYHEVDHIMPISLGGPAVESNEVKVCRGCNGSAGKWDKHPLVWIAELCSPCGEGPNG